MFGCDKENCDTENGVRRTSPARPLKAHGHSSTKSSSFAEAAPFRIEMKSRPAVTPLKQRQNGVGAVSTNKRWRQKQGRLVASLSEMVSHKPKAKKCTPRRVRFSMVPSLSSISATSSYGSPGHLDQDFSTTQLPWKSDNMNAVASVSVENKGSAWIEEPAHTSDPLRPKTPTKVPHHLSPFYPEKYLVLARRATGQRQLQYDEDTAGASSSDNKQIEIPKDTMQTDVDSSSAAKETQPMAKCLALVKQNGVCIIAVIETIVSVYPLVAHSTSESALGATSNKTPTTAVRKVMRASLCKYSESLLSMVSSATMGGVAFIYHRKVGSGKAIVLPSLSKTFAEKLVRVAESRVAFIEYNSPGLRPLRLIILDTVGFDWQECCRNVVHVLFVLCVAYQTASWALKKTGLLVRNSKYATRVTDAFKNVCAVLLCGLLLASSAMLVPSFEWAPALDGTYPYQLVSILDVCLFNLSTAARQRLNVHLDVGLSTVIGRVTSIAVSNPLQFMTNLNKLRVGVRWISFLAPLIGTSNKLCGHALDLSKKRAQRKRSVHAISNWHTLRCSLKRQYIMEDAAIALQSKFRGRRERKALHVLRVWRHQEHVGPGEKLNLWLKQKAAHARKRVERSKSFDVASEEDQARSTSSCSSCVMTPERKRRKLSSHSTTPSISQEERMLLFQTTQGFLESRVEQERRVLLLKPNTRFAVAWKVATVTSVLLELLHKALAPTVLSAQGQKKLTMDAFLNAALLRQSDFQFRAVLSSISFSDLSFSGLQQFLLSLMNCCWVLVARSIVLTVPCIVTAVCFADVFVAFFTGEVAENANGTEKRLVPKPVFARWIGVGLQLIVNPTMGSVVKGLKACLKLSRTMGHCRTMWMIILGVLPLGSAVLDAVTYFVWKSILLKQK
jgi:hypothetical protein